jgi:hypothetical protein
MRRGNRLVVVAELALLEGEDDALVDGAAFQLAVDPAGHPRPVPHRGGSQLAGQRLVVLADRADHRDPAGQASWVAMTPTDPPPDSSSLCPPRTSSSSLCPPRTSSSDGQHVTAGD